MIVARPPGRIDRRTESIVTVGTFDGLHAGHRTIIGTVVRHAEQHKCRSVVFTFDPHPREVVSTPKGRVGLLTTLDERLEGMRTLGVDAVSIIPFTTELSRLDARAFYEREILQTADVRAVVIGHDHKFGRDRTAGKEQLETLGASLGFDVILVPALTILGGPVSSTRIRRALTAGDVTTAGALLGYPYALTGTVVPGDRRGAQLGFPTANIDPGENGKLIPAAGVYAVDVRVRETDYGGMMNIGVRPTITDGSRGTLEVHLFGFTGELYGERITVRFHERLRDERRFPSVAALLEQLSRDRQTAQTILTKRSIVHSAS